MKTDQNRSKSDMQKLLPDEYFVLSWACFWANMVKYLQRQICLLVLYVIMKLCAFHPTVKQDFCSAAWTLTGKRIRNSLDIWAAFLLSYRQLSACVERTVELKDDLCHGITPQILTEIFSGKGTSVLPDMNNACRGKAGTVIMMTHSHCDAACCNVSADPYYLTSGRH